VGEERFGAPDETIRAPVNAVNDLSRLKRMHHRAVNAASCQEILEPP
jgi:hypothetical protein